jgi:hypothetical protein
LQVVKIKALTGYQSGPFLLPAPRFRAAWSRWWVYANFIRAYV